MSRVGVGEKVHVSGVREGGREGGRKGGREREGEIMRRQKNV